MCWCDNAKDWKFVGVLLDLFKMAAVVVTLKKPN
jgi:hypothetical protein